MRDTKTAGVLLAGLLIGGAGAFQAGSAAEPGQLAQSAGGTTAGSVNAPGTAGTSGITPETRGAAGTLRAPDRRREVNGGTTGTVDGAAGGVPPDEEAGAPEAGAPPTGPGSATPQGFGGESLIPGTSGAGGAGPIGGGATGGTTSGSVPVSPPTTTTGGAANNANGTNGAATAGTAGAGNAATGNGRGAAAR